MQPTAWCSVSSGTSRSVLPSGFACSGSPISLESSPDRPSLRICQSQYQRVPSLYRSRAILSRRRYLDVRRLQTCRHRPGRDVLAADRLLWPEHRRRRSHTAYHVIRSDAHGGRSYRSQLHFRWRSDGLRARCAVCAIHVDIAVSCSRRLRHVYVHPCSRRAAYARRHARQRLSIHVATRAAGRRSRHVRYLSQPQLDERLANLFAQVLSLGANAAENVQLSVTLPVGFVAQSAMLADQPCTVDSVDRNLVSCTLALLASNFSMQFQLLFVAPLPCTGTIHFEVRCDDDAVPASNSLSVTLQVLPSSKHDSPRRRHRNALASTFPSSWCSRSASACIPCLMYTCTSSGSHR